MRKFDPFSGPENRGPERALEFDPLTFRQLNKRSVAQTVERLIEGQRVGVSKAPRATNGPVAQLVGGVCLRNRTVSVRIRAGLPISRGSG